MPALEKCNGGGPISTLSHAGSWEGSQVVLSWDSRTLIDQALGLPHQVTAQPPFPRSAEPEKQVPGSISKSYTVRREYFSPGRIQNGFMEEDTLASDQRGILHKRRWENGILMRKKMAPPAFSYFSASMMSLQAAGGWQEDSVWDQLPEQRRNQNIRQHSGPGVLWER